MLFSVLSENSLGLHLMNKNGKRLFNVTFEYRGDRFLRETVVGNAARRNVRAWRGTLAHGRWLMMNHTTDDTTVSITFPMDLLEVPSEHVNRSSEISVNHQTRWPTQ